MLLPLHLPLLLPLHLPLLLPPTLTPPPSHSRPPPERLPPPLPRPTDHHCAPPTHCTCTEETCLRTPADTAPAIGGDPPRAEAPRRERPLAAHGEGLQRGHRRGVELPPFAALRGRRSSAAPATRAVGSRRGRDGTGGTTAGPVHPDAPAPAQAAPDGVSPRRPRHRQLGDVDGRQAGGPAHSSATEAPAAPAADGDDGRAAPHMADAAAPGCAGFDDGGHSRAQAEQPGRRRSAHPRPACILSFVCATLPRGPHVLASGSGCRCCGHACVRGGAQLAPRTPTDSRCSALAATFDPPRPLNSSAPRAPCGGRGDAELGGGATRWRLGGEFPLGLPGVTTSGPRGCSCDHASACRKGADAHRRRPPSLPPQVAAATTAATPAAQCSGAECLRRSRGRAVENMAPGESETSGVGRSAERKIVRRLACSAKLASHPSPGGRPRSMARQANNVRIRRISQIPETSDVRDRGGPGVPHRDSPRRAMPTGPMRAKICARRQYVAPL